MLYQDQYAKLLSNQVASKPAGVFYEYSPNAVAFDAL